MQAQRSVLDLLSSYELWSETIALSRSPAWNAFRPELQAEQHVALGSAYFFSGDDKRGRETIDALKELWLKSVFVAGGAAKADAERSPEADRNRLIARLNHAKPALLRIGTAINRLELNEAFASHDMPRLRELLEHEPSVPVVELVRMHLAAGNIERARVLALETPLDSSHRVLNHANRADVLRRAGDERQVRLQANEMRQALVAADADLPVIRRLPASLAAFRADKSKADGKNGREPLPRSRWQPVAAPDLTLPNRHGELVSLDDYEGRPVLVVFYLGAGCPHCIQQLRALAPLHQEFIDAGITVIAVSTDTMAGMREMYEVADEDGEGAKILPFVMVSDSLLDRFRAFRAFDEFDNSPLHGVFLLDAERRVLWQNTGKQPFMQIGFLLEEAKRLLTYSAAIAASADHGARASWPTFN